MYFFGFVTRFLIIVFGTLLPARYTFNALYEDDLVLWGKYWIVYAWLMGVELVGDTCLSWTPLYMETKLLLVLWLVISAPKASVWMFDTILSPLMVRYMARIDELLLHGKRHILSDALSCASELYFRSMDKIMSLVSQIRKKEPGTARKPVESAPIKAKEPLNMTSRLETSPEESHSSSVQSSQSSPQVMGMQAKRVSLSDLALKSIDQLNRPFNGKQKKKSFGYDMSTEVVNEDVLMDMDDVLKLDRETPELQSRTMLTRKETRRRLT